MTVEEDNSNVSLLERYADRHNCGVRTGEFADMLELFSEDAELRFVGFGVGPFCGLAEIAAAFERAAPTDELVLSDVRIDSDCQRAGYRWKAGDGANGAMRLVEANDRILLLEIVRDGAVS